MVIKKYTIQSRNAVKKQFKPLYCKGKLFLEKNLDQLVKLVISDAGDQGGGHPYRHGGRGQHRRLHGRPLVHGEEPRPRFPQGPKLVLREYTGKPFRNLQKKNLGSSTRPSLILSNTSKMAFEVSFPSQHSFQFGLICLETQSNVILYRVSLSIVCDIFISRTFEMYSRS